MLDEGAYFARYMRLALKQAELAYRAGEVPVGALVVKSDRVLAARRNERERSCDPTAHAEMLAVKDAAAELGCWRLSGCDVFVTLEPCPMCAGALLTARVARVIFGAFDPKQGCCQSVYELTSDPLLGGACRVHGGILEKECAALLNAFFKERRREVPYARPVT
ncbi:MAG: nucleoside deaminase [Clostridia bacterium]|nr:nucleoside deaminase [Clostridia bacterium]